MNDYAARILHDDKTKSWRHEAEEARRASVARATVPLPGDVATRPGLLARLAVRVSGFWQRAAHPEPGNPM